MTEKELKAKIKEYKAEIKATGVERPLNKEEIEAISSSFHNLPQEYQDAIHLAEQNEFGSFETLPNLIRNYIGALALRQFREKFGENPSLENEEIRQYLDRNLMNAALRAGISAEKTQESTKDLANALDTYMNAGLMKKTMMPPSEQAKSDLSYAHSKAEIKEMVEKNMERQLVMAKTMLLAQIGKYDVIDKNGLSHALEVPVYETLVHGNRTNFILPAGEDSGNVINAFMGQNGGSGAGIEKRTAATHSVKRRSIKGNGMIGSKSKELRTYNPFKIFGNQYGMDLAVGGIGERGPNKRIITGNGQSGHLYMRAEGGDAKHCGSLLIGIEGSAPGKSNSLGHSHGIRAKKARQSAFLADKSIVGKKVGGREVDLSGISAEKLTVLLNQFSKNYAKLQRDPKGREALANINDMLMGKHMDVDKLMKMFAALNINEKGLADTLSQARRGYLSQTNTKNITFEQFTQSIRGKFSQEKACKIAEARFTYAGDNLQLATGAIKELMFTHETRSLLWKILHPIKNYRENNMITDLTSRLVSEKNFTADQIASAFNCYDNSFALNWGESLSNDREAVSFAKESFRNTKFDSFKMFHVIKNVSMQFGEKFGDPKVGDDEFAQMQDELRKLINGEVLEDNDEIEDDDELAADEELDRESIVINEEDEINKSVDVDTSEIIIPNQPTIKNQKEL